MATTRLVVLLLLIALCGCATPPESAGQGIGYPPSAYAADGRPIWHRCLTIVGVKTTVCGGPTPAGYADEP